MTPRPGRPSSTLPSPSAPPIDLLLWAVTRVEQGGYNFEKCATRALGRPHIEDVAAALVVAHGSMADAAVLLGMGRGRLRAYVDRVPDLVDLVSQQREAFLDKVEKSVHERALAGEWRAQRFILTTLGRDRGYGNKLEVENTNTALAELLGGRTRATDHDLPSNGPIIDITPEPEDGGPAADEAEASAETVDPAVHAESGVS